MILSAVIARVHDIFSTAEFKRTAYWLVPEFVHNSFYCRFAVLSVVILVLSESQTPLQGFDVQQIHSKFV